ncbi:MAG: hypothetical protein Q7V10_05450 [Methanobacteriaceae archaeon]|nr:hypothetical protein [Methanobacteriaceae archaeon]MDO9627734.1 hypothetical protein [Methanobacteriaceae archaeon]
MEFISKNKLWLKFGVIVFSMNAILSFMTFIGTQSPYKLAMTFIWLQFVLFNILIYNGFTKNLFWILAMALTVLYDIIVIYIYFYQGPVSHYSYLPLLAGAVLFTIIWPFFTLRKEQIPRLYQKSKL